MGPHILSAEVCTVLPFHWRVGGQSTLQVIILHVGALIFRTFSSSRAVSATAEAAETAAVSRLPD